MEFDIVSAETLTEPPYDGTVARRLEERGIEP
ncbi:hypothetical protein HALLA_01495 (plasmid) [Halostagnicola larsenii XH-48]|uniref:Uncharacterized protein n=1 Tax=Halostagnicola larsenii XH-48 TaxID=797299 RepID=W0JTR4_9EURY|nr:hypothetical protein HALLA_01495 [Halostagnicola larsenii XH-48]